MKLTHNETIRSFNLKKVIATNVTIDNDTRKNIAQYIQSEIKGYERQSANNIIHKIAIIMTGNRKLPPEIKDDTDLQVTKDNYTNVWSKVINNASEVHYNASKKDRIVIHQPVRCQEYLKFYDPKARIEFR